ncbi:bifunctional 4-hydroxy-2-oxoglutarate aldolase/2-dehydro-3-deoxy-phosphogluconate aldolase [Robiginitalea sp. M366]|uniref:bifunctional 4-hydroxy-2-oxoglutarate aldolase/2-dehydro-3-deoxy-phosphogluconate aldolase n=1 Tax=Robiginitalea aestuariiviva TaxID=3036903 RepID=UPI00240D1F26|nr:bifunctional 4-hydroxy-2-oxoglutarate aldolase/2-dehydro-3-deoxy-phosphogluconate aldolase [Robiginitalea aestuariiviva]MDG1571087.1 bifunctional 4-hydroxy-2-oxoglutarate aldolase/2-dehydro-3-deoxy-phosphogluconate aldolase [Robiginitalea aestuariiviva]
MARFTRLEVAQKMEATGLVPLFYHPDAELCKQVVAACYRGGARLLEFTARGDFAHEVYAQLSRFVAAELPEMALGVGSITDAAAASHYMRMGADFVVTPSLREDIALVCNRRKVLWSAGCGSVTEINRAEELGCEIIKLFPGDVYGPGFVKAVKGPQPWTSIMPTGGVSTDPDNLKAWFGAGVSCVGMGSKLITASLLQAGDFASLEEQVRQTLQTIRQIRA